MSAFIYLSIYLGLGVGVALGQVARLEWHRGVGRHLRATGKWTRCYYYYNCYYPVLEGDGEVDEVEVQVLELQVRLG